MKKILKIYKNASKNSIKWKMRRLKGASLKKHYGKFFFLLYVNIFIFEEEKNEIEKFSRWGIAVDVVYRFFNDLNLYLSLSSSNKLKN